MNSIMELWKHDWEGKMIILVGSVATVGAIILGTLIVGLWKP